MSISFGTARMLFFYLAFVVCASPLLAAPGNPSKPNIVLVLMDNFGYGEVAVRKNKLDFRQRPITNLLSNRHQACPSGPAPGCSPTWAQLSMELD